jgi:hypothetical protein
MLLRAFLPEHHPSTELNDVLKLLLGLIGTMSALVLGLLIATAASSYNTRNSEFRLISANIIVLDRVLALYGPETKEARDLLRRSVAHDVQRMWPENGTPLRTGIDPADAWAGILYDKIQQLGPQNDAQRSLKAQALTMFIDFGRTRWLLVEQRERSIPIPFLVVLVFWLSALFTSFGFFAPPNATLMAALLIGALSVSGAIFLILELDQQPFTGLMQMSSAPLLNAVAQLGK